MNTKKMIKVSKMTKAAALRLVRWDGDGFGSIRKGKKAALMARKKLAKLLKRKVDFFG